MTAQASRPGTTGPPDVVWGRDGSAAGEQRGVRRLLDFAQRNREDDVLTMNRDEVMLHDLGVAAKQLHGGIGQRDELALGGVQQVGEPAAVAIAGQRRDTDDAVARRIDGDALITMLHGSLFGRTGAKLKPRRTRLGKRPGA